MNINEIYDLCPAVRHIIMSYKGKSFDSFYAEGKRLLAQHVGWYSPIPALQNSPSYEAVIRELCRVLV